MEAIPRIRIVGGVAIEVRVTAPLPPSVLVTAIFFSFVAFSESWRIFHRRPAGLAIL